MLLLKLCICISTLTFNFPLDIKYLSAKKYAASLHSFLFIKIYFIRKSRLKFAKCYIKNIFKNNPEA